MGHIYAINPRTGRQVLCCDACGSFPARKYPCPHNYCPATALCPSCRSKYGTGDHSTCKEKHAAYVAEIAEREANPAAYVASAFGSWCTGTDDVLVCTHADTYYLVPKDYYHTEQATNGGNIRITAAYRAIDAAVAQDMITAAYRRP